MGNTTTRYITRKECTGEIMEDYMTTSDKVWHNADDLNVIKLLKHLVDSAIEGRADVFLESMEVQQDHVSVSEMGQEINHILPTGGQIRITLVTNTIEGFNLKD